MLTVEVLRARGCAQAVLGRRPEEADRWVRRPHVSVVEAEAGPTSGTQ